MINSASFNKFHEIVLRHRRRHISPAVHRKIRSPRQRKIEPDEGGLFVPKLAIPKLIRRYRHGMQYVEFALFQQR